VERPDFAIGRSAAAALLEGLKSPRPKSWQQALLVPPVGVIDFGTVGEPK